MTLVKKNIAANLFGGLWTALMSLVFVPLYVYFLGIEAFGLVGLFTSLAALFGLLDLGMSGTLNREMARLSARSSAAQQMHDLLRTLEIPYWLMGLAVAAIVILVSPWIAYHWLNVQNLSPDSARTAIMVMGLCLACRFPIGFYAAGLMGLQRQVLVNGIHVAEATIRGLGAVVVLWLVSPTIEAFFWWQFAVSGGHLAAMLLALRGCLPPAPGRASFRLEVFRDIWRFAAGVTGISVLGTILMQLDKVILSRMLSLEVFGYYTLASVVAMTLYRLIRPVFSAVYPRLSALIALDARAEIAALYHKSAQLISVLSLPAAVVIVLFSRELLWLWTQNAETAERAHLLVSILVAGTALNGLMNVPYALQLASGWTRLALVTNLISVLVLVPLMIILTRLYGVVGAASVWPLLNLGYVALTIPVMHRRLLPREQWRWYVNDVGRPLAAALAVALLGRYLLPSDVGRLPLLIGIGLVSGASLLAAALAANELNVVQRARSLWSAARLQICG